MLNKIFWDGLKIFVPIALTVAIIIWFFTTIESFFGRFLRYFIPQQYYFDGLGILVGIALILLLGILVRFWMIRYLYTVAQGMVNKIPLVKSIYTALQDLLNYFDKSQTQEQQTVMVKTNMGNVIGFITKESLNTLEPPIGNESDVLVYIPMSYMIGGIIVVAPRNTVTPVDWSVNSAMSFIITAGMGRSRSKEI